MFRHIKGVGLLFLSLILVSLLKATPFVDLDWSEWRSDTLLPFYTGQVKLGQDYSDYTYQPIIEYPEFELLGKSDVVNLRLDNYKERIGEWPIINLSVGVSAKEAFADIGFIPIVLRDGKYYRINSFKINLLSIPVDSEQKKSTQRFLAIDRGVYKQRSVLSSGKWVKIRVNETGVYKLTDSRLREMGFIDPSRVRLFGYGGNILPRVQLGTLPDDMPEVPLWRENGYSLFFAKGPVKWEMAYNGRFSHTQNSYSQYGYYFLTESDSLPLSFMEEESVLTLPGTELVTYPDYALFEKELFSWYHSGSQFFDSYNYVNGNSREYPFALDGITNDSVVLTVSFSASHSSSTTLSVKVNGQHSGDLYIPPISSNEVATVSEISLVCRDIFSSNSIVNLTHIRPSGISGRLDYIRLNYTRELAMRESQVLFRTGQKSGNVFFKIARANPDVKVWRIDPSGQITLLPSSFNDGFCTTQTLRSNTQDQFLAVDVKGVFNSPEIVGRVENQNLHGMDPVDMVIIVPASGHLTGQAERLAQAHRDFDSLSVAVVRADMIFNEFSSGTPDATAYRRFLKMLYDRSDVSMPRYLLLFGDGAWDNRMVTDEWKRFSPDDFLLCYESENSLSHTKSYVMEDYFGLLDDGEGSNLLADKVDLGVGRFPVRTEESAKQIVDKTISYMSNLYSGPWLNRIAFLGDDGDNNAHMKDIDYVANMVALNYPSLQLRKIYWDAYKMEVSASGNSYPSVRKALLDQFDDGVLMVNYSGHGSADVLSHEKVLDKNDMLNINSTRLPLWIAASCDINPFDATTASFGENALLNSSGGAIGVFSTTRTVYSTLNKRMNMLFTDYVLGRDESGLRYSIGDAVRLAKTSLVTSGSDYQDYSENKLHFVLLGDPALRLGVAEERIVVDSFDNSPANGPAQYAKAGGVVSVSGHVEISPGVLDNTFTGKIFSVVLDNERIVTTLNNTSGSETPFTYSDRDRILFSGSDSVKNGVFRFSFPVPLDINYSDKNGMIKLYAARSDKSKTVNGYFDNFLVGGTSDAFSSDSLGPEIWVYLNTPDFEYGGRVNQTPYLVAELYDLDGLNNSGNGIGHDIMITIDNNPDYTYILNNYFVSSQGDYSRGLVTFVFPELPEGYHTLVLRAWDVLNNSNTATLGFVVVNNLRPQINKIQATKNPAKTYTSFIITHDRPGNQVGVKIEVFDTSGRIVWDTATQNVSTNGIIVVDWNLCGNGGHSLTPGIYLYRCTIVFDEGTRRTASDKLIIISD